MRIAYVFQDEYPWDIRADKITASLALAGHQTTIISRNRSGLPVHEKLGSNLMVRRLPGSKIGILRSLLNLPAFFSPVWLWVIYSTVKNNNIDLIIVRDLPMAAAAWFIGKITKKPVVMDMAEDYPAMIQDTWTYRGPGKLDFIIRNPKLLRKMERWILPRLNGVLTVSEPSNDRVLGLVSGQPVRTKVIQNTPRLVRDKGLIVGDVSADIAEISDPVILYVGGLEESRGLKYVVEAIAEIRKQNQSVTLAIVGEGTSKPALMMQAKALGIEDKVRFYGWADQKYVPGIIDAADICIVPHIVTQHTDTTLPNKIYDYMAQAKPVIVTHSRALRSIVEKHSCGFWYNDTDSKSLASLILRIVQDVNGAKSMGERGQNAVDTSLNWDEDAQLLVDYIEAF